MTPAALPVPNPAISVIVPFFDSAEHIEGCVASLRAQRLGDDTFEILLVDNGSRDASRSIVERASAADERIQLLREDQPGAYAARNLAISRARAPICAFTDADCRAHEGWLEAIQRAMAPREVGAVVGRCSYPPTASLALRLMGAYENAKTEFVLTRCPPAYRFVYANNLAVRTSLFREIGPFRTWRRAGDTELIHRMAHERPELEVHYAPDMHVTHHEFLSARHRFARLRVYTGTNARIEGFRELGVRRRLAVLAFLARTILRRDRSPSTTSSRTR